MSSRFRRSLVLCATAALLIATIGGSAPAVLGHGHGPRHGPRDTRVAGIDVDAATIPELQRAMNRHRLSSFRLTLFYLHRIWKLNPKLHAVTKVSPTALGDALKADWARRRGSDLPLLGIPVLLKDNINTTGMPNTAGSWALAGSSPRDAFIVKQLRAAGAVILGKTNLSEWANFRSTPSSSGWSGIGGQTNMAYAFDRNPCGSSSGSGVAASANLATITVGTETDGSIVCPAGANGDVGIKPTLGLLSRAGVIPISAEQDTAGPITRNVTDAAVMLGAMTGIDAKDAATAGQAGHAFTDYTQFLDKHALDGARIGVWREGTYDPTVSPDVDAILNQTIDVLESEGAVIVDPARIPIEDAYEPEFAALLCEFKSDIASYLETYTRPKYPKTLQDLIDFNDAHPGLEGPWNSAVFVDAEATGGRADPACTEAREAARSIAQAAIDDLMADHHLDAIIAPTNGPAWLTDPVNGDLGGDFSTFVGSSSPSAIAGYATITVPAGFSSGLPIGVSFIAGQWDEPELIGLAYDFEQASHARKPPKFLPTLGASAKHGHRVTDPADRTQPSRLAPLR
jgi:amidase